MALAPALGLAIIAGWGFDILFAVCVLVLLLATVVMKGFPYKNVEKPVRAKERQGKFWSNLISVDALPASVIMMFISVPYGGVSVFIALYGELYGLGSAGLFFTLFAIGTGSTRLVSGRIADKKGEKPMIATGCSLLLLSLMLLLTANSFFYYASGLLYGIGSGVLLPTMQAMSMRTVPAEKRGAASSTYQCSYDIASGAGGFIAGWIVTVWGYRPMFAALGIFPVIAVLVYALWASKTPSAFKVYQRNRSQIK
jgi:MFS family permease